MKTSTRFDRYPGIMSFVRDHLGDAGRAAPRILSFGCSTGEECATLRTYFPGSRIAGVDTNIGVLRAARRSWRHLLDGTLTLEHSSTLEQEPDGSFDVVFCMSVLVRHPETMDLDDCSRCYAFDEFDAQVTLLDRLIRPGGLLVIQNSNFRFSEATVAERYLHLSGASSLDGLVKDLAMFDRNNQRVRGVEPETVFKKMGSKEARGPQEGILPGEGGSSRGAI